ncbi:MAG TPA: hypothetical protein VHE61_08560 [Opitutaceae bacterium]|nr:hypothetical protein [Opitutaceae bacterium]
MPSPEPTTQHSVTLQAIERNPEIRALQGPANSTSIIDWFRVMDTRADGATVHRLCNLCAQLVSVRTLARETGWTDTLLQWDGGIERSLRQVISRAQHAWFPAAEQAWNPAG